MESHTFPDTLAGFGYGFNENGQMRQIDRKTGQITNTPFQFEVKPNNHGFNQAHYEALGEVITEEVYHILRKDTHLDCVQVYSSELLKNFKDKKLPHNVPSSFIFASKDYKTNEDKLLVLIHGAGVVRAGQWARRLIINEDLNKGTQVPFIKWATKQGYAVLVLNTNHNTDVMNGKEVEIPGSESPENHAITVWQQFIGPSKAKNIVIIAHSYGGLVTMELVSRFKEDFLERVKAVLLTDSVHGGLPRDKDVRNKLIKIGINYVSSEKPLGTKVDSFGDLACVSAGHPKHEWTSYSAMEEIFHKMRKVGLEESKEEEGVKPKYDKSKYAEGEHSMAQTDEVSDKVSEIDNEKDKDSDMQVGSDENEKKRNLSGESSVNKEKEKLEKKEL